MESEQFFAALSGVLLFVVSAVVGIRLLRLARRTRQLPEFAFGFGLSSVILLGAPAMMAGGLGRVAAGEVNLPATALGFAGISVGFVAFYVFNWKVFRPNSSWAPFVVATGVLLLGTSSVGSFLAVLNSSPEASSLLVTQKWIVLLWIAAIGSYAWMASEALLEYRLSRRRLALGLADPTVTNRFLLWGLANLVQTASNGTNLVLHFQGITPSNDALPATLSAIGGLCCCVAMSLAFMPPAAYLRYLRRGRETT